MNEQYASALLYWMKERDAIRVKKESGLPRPWSMDPVFKTTYFCNVRREDDKVTKWIREFYNPFVNDPMFEYNIILSRFVNRPESLKIIGYQRTYQPGWVDQCMSVGGRWGSAYVITTHGIPMSKASYLARNVLGGAYRSLQALQNGCRGSTLGAAHAALQGLEGLGSFLAAQVVADLKNTKGHPLNTAKDWHEFVAWGPGSLRGASWVHYGEPGRVGATNFRDHFDVIADFVRERLGRQELCNQDIQNCLCEFDKYCRVRTGIGRSKRRYNG